MSNFLTFLRPHNIPHGHARMRFPDGSVKAVPDIPDWYWRQGARIIAQSTINLRGDLLLYTYFTCEEDADGTLYRTMCLDETYDVDWSEVARARTAEEARLMHHAIRTAWAITPPATHPDTPDPATLAEFLKTFTPPPHPHDVPDDEELQSGRDLSPTAADLATLPDVHESE